MKTQSRLDQPYELELPCIRIRQPIGDFFIAAIDSRDLVEITFADVRRMYEEREVETYLGIQRPLNPTRVKEISQYVNTVDACFPTSVILAIEGKCVEFDEDRSRLILRSELSSTEEDERITSIKIAKVLDGQHRIEGLKDFSKGSFQVNVSIFVDMDIEGQAYLFSTVNLAQTKVNRSLVYDLFEYSRSRSPQKTCHKIAVALDAAETSPFYKRIKRLGSATAGRFNETLTQASFVEAFLPYLTDNKILDRDLFMRGKRPIRATAEESRKLIFRNMFLDEKDMEIADIIFNYFSAVKEKWPIAWGVAYQGNMLNKTNGFKALTRLLRPIYLSLSKTSEVPSKEEFAKVFNKALLKDEELTVDNFKPGTSGQADLYQRLFEQLKL